MRWPSSLMKPGVSWALPGGTHNTRNLESRDSPIHRCGRAACLQDECPFEHGDAAAADVRLDCPVLSHRGAPEQQTGPSHIDALMNAPSTLGPRARLERAGLER